MRIDILTLFPEMFAPLEYSIVKRAVDKGILQLNLTNIRDFTTDKHGTADDRIYGGGAGMVMKPDPVFAAIRQALPKDSAKVRIVVTSPAGKLFTQKDAVSLAKAEQIIFICGHYEGLDQRVEDEWATDVFSIGDFVLTGGEVPAMVMADSVTRLLPGVLGDDSSSEEESFSDGLLEYPQYTRPPVFEGREVPAVLLGGNHRDITRWRREQALSRTYQRRPELLNTAVLTDEDQAYLGKLRANSRRSRLWLALVHYPVYNKKKEIINTSLTNLDLHDIARAASTYDIAGYFVVQPQAGQRELINTLLSHWQKGFGANYNPDRRQALELVHLVDSLDEAVRKIDSLTGSHPQLVATSAKAHKNMIGYAPMRQLLADGNGDYLLIFGTGWGLTDEIIAGCNYLLRPVYGVSEYNHLSVRSAVSIILDRLRGERE